MVDNRYLTYVYGEIGDLENQAITPEVQKIILGLEERGFTSSQIKTFILSEKLPRPFDQTQYGIEMTVEDLKKNLKDLEEA